MDKSDTHPSSSEAGLSQLQAEIDSLRQLVVSLLILLIVVSGTLNVYLLRQWRSTQTELKMYRSMVTQYNKDDFPQITNYVAKLTDYGKTHTNFVPILKRYGLDNIAAGAPPATSALPPAKSGKK